jgi:hypothetical protein
MNAPEQAPVEAPAVTVRCIAAALPPPEAGPAFLFDGPDLPADLSAVCGLLLPAQGEARARELLARGSPRVYVGEAALLDSGVIERLVREFGSQRIGVYVPARRMGVSWSLDSVSNADFKVMTPSVCEPCWEILTAEGRRTGTIASWWIGEMFRRGASAALVRADIRDDGDLNVCATLAEQCRERLWIGPLEDEDSRFAEWVSLGRVTQLAVPEASYHRSEQLAALRGAADTLPAAQEA